MDYQTGHVLTLANSIIGVSVLAMPYCFKQCGIFLSILMLLLSSIISRLSCHFLLKSAIITRRKTFENLAFYTFGTVGKFIIEVGIIGFLIGTCIAFFVVMGDLGPEIVSEISGTVVSSTMRTSILMALALFCVLPLGLLRNVDSLNGVSKATIGFYCSLVLKIIFEALPHIFAGDWFNNVTFWRPEGILQCLPIFSMALFCQTQLFEIYQVLPNASLEDMNSIIRVAVNICTSVYIFVGAFGYIAFSNEIFSGNILVIFSPSIMTDVMKIGFVLSVAFSFPLVIFPCRASLYSLLYKNVYPLHDGANSYIPEGKFKGLTLVIVLLSLVIGIMIPNIELVLGLIGSTIGVMICVLFPVTCFICISPKNTNERILAQVMLGVGVLVMILGTYKNLDVFEATTRSVKDITDTGKIQDSMNQKNILEQPLTVNHHNENDLIGKHKASKTNGIEFRHEPPQPEEVIENVNPEKKKDIVQTTENQPLNKVNIPNISRILEKKITLFNQDANKDILQSEVKTSIPISKLNDNEQPKVDNLLNEDFQKVVRNETVISLDSKQNDEVDADAIIKEETELKEQEKDKQLSNQILLDTLQTQNKVHQEIVEQQKKLIEVIQKQQDINKKEIEKVNEEKLEAMQNIKNIALKAIESIGGKDNKKIIADLEKNINEVDVHRPEISPEKYKATVNININSNSINIASPLSSENKNNTKDKINYINLPPIPISKNNILKQIKSEKLYPNNNTIMLQSSNNTNEEKTHLKIEDIPKNKIHDVSSESKKNFDMLNRKENLRRKRDIHDSKNLDNSDMSLVHVSYKVDKANVINVNLDVNIKNVLLNIKNSK